MLSLRAMLSRWLVVLLTAAALSSGGVVAGTTASAQAGAATGVKSVSNGSTTRSGQDAAATSSDGEVSNATWMHDLAPHIWYRSLSQVVIPGSHDSASYSLGGEFLGPYAQTQNEDFTAQLNDGARNFDIRVEYRPGRSCIWCGVHGIVAGDLSFMDILDQIENWTLQSSHYDEVLLLGLRIDQAGTSNFPTDECWDFDRALGSALLTPNEAQAHFGTTDPGQITFGQLWSLHGPEYFEGPPRVIMTDNRCMDAFDPSAGQWSDTATDGGGLFGGYYADQCYAAPYTILGDGKDGIENPTLEALQYRATQGGGDDNGHVMNLGPTKPGGFYNVGIASTPTQDCFIPLHWLLGEDKTVLDGIYHQFQSDWQDPDQAGAKGFLANLNIVSGDYIQETDLVHDAIAMNETYPIQADTVTREGPETVTAEQDQPFPAGSFAATVDYGNIPVDQQQVTYTVSPPDSTASPGPTVNGSDTATALSHNGVVNLDDLSGAPRPGTWNLTASLPNGAKATWTLDVVPSTHYTLQPDTRGNDDIVIGQYPAPAVHAGSTTERKRNSAGHSGFDPAGLKVFAVNAQDHRVPGVQVTFDAAAAGGTFPGGAKTATATTSNAPGDPQHDGVATSPPFTAGTRAGPMSLLVSSPGAPTQTLALTVVPEDEVRFVPLGGDGQSTPINTTFSIPLTGYLVDKFGNVFTRTDLIDNDDFQILTMSVLSNLATWPGGSLDYQVPISAVAPDGTMTAPTLTAGKMVAPNTADQDAGKGLRIIVNPVPSGWRLGITPGPPATVSAASGDGQHTDTGKPFAKPLAVKVTDSAGNPIPGAEVTFQVTAGAATFQAPDLTNLAKVRDDPAPPPNTPNPPRTTIAMPTDANGVATAPVLTANQSGPIEVTASASGVPAANDAVFHLFASGNAPTAPTVTGLRNGDGQVAVAFSEASDGNSPVTYKVTATDRTHPGTQTATGQSPPIVVTGLSNGDTYVFAVIAIAADGTTSSSPPSGALNVGVAPAFESGPANGAVGQVYSSGFTVSGAPAPAVTQKSGDLPPGLTLSEDGKLTGTPTQSGNFDFTVEAVNNVGIADDTVMVSISS